MVGLRSTLDLGDMNRDSNSQGMLCMQLTQLYRHIKTDAVSLPSRE